MAILLKCLPLILAIFGCYLWMGNFVDARTSDLLRVTLSNGYSKLIGRYMRSYDGRGIRAFLGVPFAEPPVGNLRFRAPVPIAPWHGERDAIVDSDICTQLDPFRRQQEVSGSEDCLYLNVYAPQEPKTNGPLPVMVWIHGGGFMCGAGISTFYGPEHLLDQDIVYVAFNYRLGSLGFLSTGDKTSPGNYGLKDQALALKWIKENIAAFGGDANSITIFGESAGGASVTYLMASPLTKGLFHKAIAMSGTYLNPWSQPAHEGVAEQRATELAKKMGCPIISLSPPSDWTATIECLRTIDGDAITKAFYDFFEWDTDPMVAFPPVVEPDLPGAFLTKHPRDITEPHSQSVPLLAGITMDEGLLKTTAIFGLPELYADFKVNMRSKALPTSLYYHHHPVNVQQKITQKVIDFYLKNGQLTPETHQNLTNMYGDNWFGAGIDDYLRNRLLAQKSSNSHVGVTYVYMFAHKGSASFTEIFEGGRENYYGVTHAEDLMYLFPASLKLFVTSIPTPEDQEMRKSLTELWANFARTSNPTPSDETKLPKWKPANSYPLNYLRIGNKDQKNWPIIAMEKGLLDERLEFWRKLQVHVSVQQFVIKDEL